MKKGVDTPYSWIVCISAFFINFFAVGSSFLVTGTLSSYWRNELCAFDNRSCTDTEISWIQSLIVIFWMMIGAPISKQIIPKIGYRWTLWIGGFLMMIGAVLSSMVTSIYYLYATMGVIFGMGVGLCYLPHLLVAGEYFNEQRNNAFAIISSGNTIANLILVKLIDFLINEFGLRYGLMTFGGVVFNIIVLAIPCVSLASNSDSTKEAKQILDDIIEVEEEESKQSAKLDQLKPERVDHLKSGFSLAESQQLYTQRIRSRVDSRAGNITDSFLAVHANNDVNGSFMSLKSAQILQKYKAGEAVHMSNADASTLWMESQLSVAVSQKRSRKGSYISQKSKTGWRNSVYVQLFKSKRYTLMFFCDTMGFFAYMIVMQYLTDKMTNAGLPRSDATWCIAILGIANTISKWTCGFLCNKKYLKTYSMYAWSHILSGLVSCMIVFANSTDETTLRYQCFAFSCILGLTIGPYSLTPSVQADIVPFESMPSAMNMITVGEGIALMLGPIVAGVILDQSGKNYNLLFVTGGISMLVTGILPLLVYFPCCQEKHERF